MGSSDRRAIWVSWALVALWAVFIFVASATTGYDYDMGNGPLAFLKKWIADALSSVVGAPVDPSPIGHFGEYFVFGALLANALRFLFGWKRVVALAICIAAAYAITDELHQYFVPGRFCDISDFIVDTVAASLSATAFTLWQASFRNKGLLD